MVFTAGDERRKKKKESNLFHHLAIPLAPIFENKVGKINRFTPAKVLGT